MQSRNTFRLLFYRFYFGKFEMLWHFSNMYCSKNIYATFVLNYSSKPEKLKYETLGCSRPSTFNAHQCTPSQCT